MTAGIDLALALVEEDLGPAVALAVAMVSGCIHEAPGWAGTIQAPRYRCKRQTTSLGRYTNGLTIIWPMICRFPYWPIEQE